MTESASGQVGLPVPPAATELVTEEDTASEPTRHAATEESDGAVQPADPDGGVPETGDSVRDVPEGTGSAGGEPDGPPAQAPHQPINPAPASGSAMGDYRMALIAAVNVDLPNQHPTVVLRESESPRRQLSFSIGLQDAVVLTHAMRRIPTPRPLTHELMSQVLQGFDIDVVAVRLVGRQGSIYFAELDLRGRTGRSVFSCRPSDGLTIALLQPVSVPILIDRRLFEVDGDVTPPGPGAPPPA
jgi:hypothetical protein